MDKKTWYKKTRENTSKRAEMQCSDVNPGTVQKAELEWEVAVNTVLHYRVPCDYKG